jgi:hypothetical protein
MLGKTDCGHCQEYTEELHVYLGGDAPGEVSRLRARLERLRAEGR